MGIFSQFFDFFRPKVQVYFGPSGRSSPWNREAYEQETVRAIIDCIASHTAKSQAMHVIEDKQGRIKEIKRSSPYARLLNQQPNTLMSGFDLKYKLVAQLEDKTTAMAFIKWDGLTPKAIIPVQYSNFEFFGIKGGGYAVRFVDETDWKEYILNVEDVVILRKFFNHHPIAGDGNQPINNTLTMIKASDEGLTEALTVANKVRGLLKQKKAMLAPEDVKKSTDDFVNRFKTAAKEGGIIGVDSMEDFTPLNVTPWSTNAAQMREIRENLFYYWRISEPILKSSYTSDQWQAFYESVIEPILIQMGQAFTNACFTQREKDVGNRIIFTSSAMINASTSEKVQLVNATREIGLMTTNEQRELFGLPPVEGGDERIISLNYIKQSDMSKYQTGQEPQEDPGNTGGQEPQGDQGGQEQAAEEGAGDGGKGGEESGE